MDLTTDSHPIFDVLWFLCVTHLGFFFVYHSCVH